MELGTILVFLVSVLVGAYFYIKNKHTYWIKKGIAGPKPQFFFGNAFDPIKNGLAATELQWMKNYGQMYGIYIGLTPALTITEPDLIKQVMIRDLPTVFMNRRKQKFEHEIWSKNLFHSEGDLWKKIRSITSVAFTSAKMRNMSGLMNQCVDRLILYFDKLVESENSVVNIKEVLAGYTIDIIGTTSFAVQTNANDDR
ncbi:PREDICTED: cytochrome P450 3A11-like, partial [Rhagoletis zephyria]|uniref:cytochrome P450 3A11-like n=1 Tax=Rhagoletis zephyria TaxID=28612 RepID=UPI00081127AA